MESQILDTLAIDPQPVIDIGIFLAGVTFLNFEEPVLIDAGSKGSRKIERCALRQARR
jgi:hypothetical protein